MQNSINFALNVDEIRDIVTEKFKMRISGQVRNVLRAASDEVIHTNHGMAFLQEPVTEMRT
jgi:hypothetical protein